MAGDLPELTGQEREAGREEISLDKADICGIDFRRYYQFDSSITEIDPGEVARRVAQVDAPYCLGNSADRQVMPATIFRGLWSDHLRICPMRTAGDGLYLFYVLTFALIQESSPMSHVRFRIAVALSLFSGLLPVGLAQQTPIALPSTMTTLAGTSPMSAATGTQCPNLAVGVKSTDAYGDGCLAVNGVFGAAGRGGVQVDSFGNVFVADDISSVIHVIDPVSGIMSVLAGGASSICTASTGVGVAGAVDTSGDGCPAATQTKTPGQRGIGIDPYGNVLLAGYSDNLLHVVCRTASPLCIPTQIGYMELVAGCVKNAGTAGSGGVGVDNVKAVQTFVTAGCTTSTGEVDQPRGASADIYGNVYFADTATSRTRVVVGPLTSSYFTGNNPLYAALALNYASVTQGYVYSVVNTGGTSTTSGGTATVKGAACVSSQNSGVSGNALDTLGDGCPLTWSSVAASSGYTSGVAVDAAGNMVFTDPSHGLRVFYVSGAGSAGTLMTNAIIANNPGVTPQAGFIYLLWGGGATALSTTPTLGTSTAATDTTLVKVTVSPQGNIYIGDSSKLIFYDMSTGYVRLMYASSSNVTAGNYCTGTSGQKSLSAYSDGCPASKAVFSNSNGLGVAADGQDNLYLYDASSNSTGMLVRKILAQGLASQTVGTPLIQTFAVHVPETSAGSVSAPTATLTSTPDMTAGTVTCGAQNADFSFDCTVPVTATPSAAGARSATLTVSVPFTPISGTPSTAIANIALGGVATGSVMVLDSATTTSGSSTTPIAPTTTSLFSNITPEGVALDGAGNVYVMDSHAGEFLEYVQGTDSVILPGTLPVNPGQLAVDLRGDVFAVGSGTPTITELAVSGAPASAGAASTFTSATIAYVPVSGTATPQAIAVDGAGNIFVADKQSTTANTAIYRLSLNGTTVTNQVTVWSGLTNPVSLAVDDSGDVYVADQGTSSVYKLTPGVVSGVPGYVQTTVAGLSGVTPLAAAVDAAGDLYVQDAVSMSVIEVPVSGPNTTVLNGLGRPTGLAVDGKGTVYSADSNSASITQIVRNAVTYNFGIGSAGSATFAGTLTDVGNQSITGSNTVTNTTYFNVAGGTSNGCAFSSSILGAQSAGNACTLVANFVGTGTGTVSDVLSYLPAASTVGSVTLTGTLTGTSVATTTTISAPSPANPSYSSSGTEATFTVTVMAASGNSAPGGTVAVKVDGTTTNPSLVASGANGVATATLSGLTAGNHTISAIYGTSSGFTGSNSGTAQSFSIAQAGTTTTWTAGATTVQYSSPIGTAALNAVATAGGSPVAGAYVYTANGTEVNAATYLPIGSYTLGVTFYPTDSVDFGSSTASGGNFTVTKATTTAVVGATQNLVAADGTGNYTSVQTAVNALANTGGSIYIKPGTYNGFVTVVKPNVSMYGLGGNASNVILTNEDGAFSAPFLPGQGVGNNGSSGDQGSATMVVARGTVGPFTGTPSGFYADNLTVANTYDTDTVTTTTNAVVGGTCTANQPAQTLSFLYNAGTLCNSQALAIWITGDQVVLNNIYANSLQDTIYAGAISGGNAYASRQYWFRGKVTGDVDYIFGDAAAVFDHASIYTTYHGTSATGTETIEAQNQSDQTGASPSYLSGYVMNSDVFTSQSSGMSNLYFGRPYGHYSTWIMLNSFVDQVNPLGYIEFQGDTNLPTSTYAEYNDMIYTDPSTGSPDANGVTYVGTGGSSGAGVTGVRETTSQDPGTPEAGNTIRTSLSQAQAQQYYPVAFLGSTVPTSPYNTVTNWNPTVAIASGANGFVPASQTNSTTVTAGSSVTIVMRPQTPGLGAITNGVYTIPTGAYTLSDTFNGATTTLASGSLDASGEAYLTTSTLATGAHNITMSYGGDSNFSASTTSTPYVLLVAASGAATPVVSIRPAANATYGAATSVTVTVSPASGTTVPTGQVVLSVDGGASQTGSLSATGSYTFALSSLAAGRHSLSVIYYGDNNFAPTISSSAMVVARSILQVAANTLTIVVGQPVPTYTASITGFVNGDTQASAVTGSPALTTSPAIPSAVGVYPITASTGTLASTNYTFTFTNGALAIQSATQAPAVATGDSRTVTEPVIPAVCATLNASLTSVSDDLPTSVDGTITNPDGARIQSALNSCANTNQVVQLSVDGAGHNAYLTGPLNMPSGVTLLVDPGVFVYFSRNAQDYDVVPGTHTCGTVNNNSATSSCLPLININGVSNVGIMGYGKLDGRGGDTLLNAIAPYQGQSWWGLSAIANSGGSQQNPRFIQLNKATNVTLYKITLRNSPLFHVSGAANGLTAWDVKIVTPTSSRNTDGIDPDQAQNFTITRSWISDGDDNVAVGASGSASSASVNMSITNNHFFAGHGESIGSYTSAGVSNILWDSNISSGNGTAGAGSSVSNTADSNSTGIRIKSGYDRGGVVQNIQYSNSCYQYHPTEIQFTPVYDTTPGTLTPNYHNILLQNLSFLTAGSVGLTGSNNNGSVFPLGVTLDNVSFASLSASNMTPAPTNAALTYGPGQVSSNFVTDFAAYVGSNGNTLTDNRTATSLLPPACSFTYIAPELTGPSGLPQTILSGQTATAVVILTPAVAGMAYPTGTVTLTDGAASTTTVTLTGTGDTVSIPLTGLSVGTHTFTATYSGDSNYVPSVSGSPYLTTAPYLITVNAGSLVTTSTSLSGVPATTTFGTAFTATATVGGSSATGTVEFIVNGAVYATSALSASGTAQASFNLPVGSFTLSAVYSGDAVNAGSSSASMPLTVGPESTTTTLSAGNTTTTLGHPVSLTATVASLAGTPAGTVNFTYSTSSGGTQITAGSSTLNGGIASASVNLPQGVDYVTATYVASGSYSGSVSTPAIAVTVNLPTIIGLPNSPIALPYTMTTIAGGAGLAIPSSGNMACAGATDKYGDGCQATAISFTSADDMRAVVGDPFGNVYLSDISAKTVRRIAPNGVITNFAGLISGTACVPSATVGCTPTLVSLSKARGVGSDAAGDIYIADYSLNKVFKVSVSTGLMYLVAGTGTAGSLGDGSAATSAQVNAPRGVWGDSVGNIYIASTSANNIRVVDANGIIHTLAGTGTAGSIGDGGPATAAELSNPQGVITDANLNVYIADSSSAKIRVVCVTCGTNSPLDALLAKVGVASPVNGDIYTIAGGATANPSAYPVLATHVLMSPQKMALDTAGNLYISDGNGIIWFLDFHSGYIRPIASNSATLCSAKTDSYGDGCPATQASFGDGGNGIGVGTDVLGNIFIADTTNGLIRKVVTGLASPATAAGSTVTQSVEVHYTPGDSPAATNPYSFASAEWQPGSPTCSTNPDSTVDCVVSSNFMPAVPGARSTPLTVTSAAGNVAQLALTGTGLGAGATLDPASQVSFGSSLQITGIASDNAGNIYVADANSKAVLKYAPAAVAQGVSATGSVLTTLTAPSAVAVDGRGFVYAADSSTGLITQVSPAGAVTTLSSTFSSPVGLAVDSLNNLYVSDSAAKSVYEVSPITGVQRTLALGSLTSPAGVAIDPAGNLLVTDPGAGAIYRFNLSSNVRTAVTSPAVKPSAVASDAAGNLLIADTGAIYAVPVSANSSAFTVASLAPSTLAIDAAGNLYTNSNSSVLKLVRTQGYGLFQNINSAPQSFSLLESGNQALQLSSVSQSDTTDYSLTATASTDCTLNGTLPSSDAVGGVCALTASFTPSTYANPTDTATFNGNLANAALSTPASVQLVLAGPAVAPTATIALGTFSPASPVYGQAVTISATVTSASIAPTGTVVFTVDSSKTTSSASLVNGVATVTLTGLSAGPHSVVAIYASNNGYASASTSASTVTVAQAAQTITFTAPASPVTFGVVPIALGATGGASGNAVSFSVVSGPGTISGSTLTVTGVGTIQIAANQAGNVNYAAAAQVTQSIVANQATQTINFTSPASPVTFGVAPIALSATGGASGNAVVFSVVSGPGTISGRTLTVTGVGTIQIAANQAGNANYAAAAQVTQSIVVNKVAPTVGLQSSLNPALVQTAVTLTATVSSAAGQPTGTVTFLDGTTPLGTSTVTSGVATLTTSTLAAGSHTITAVYSGDGNFVSLTSPALTETVEDFSLSIATGGQSSLTILPGGSGTLTFTLSPTGATFPAVVTLSLSGLPAGATYTFSPASISAGSAATTVTLTIQIPQNVAADVPIHIRGNGFGIESASIVTAASHDRRLAPTHPLRAAPIALAMLLLPFAGRLRRAGKKLGGAVSILLLLVAGVAATIGVSGCGSSGSGFFGQAPQAYTLSVTATSGSQSRSTNITLTVE
jgi:sugar lactone lactonase YvrE